MDAAEKIAKIRVEIINGMASIKEIAALQKEISLLIDRKKQLKLTTEVDRKLDAGYAETIKALKKELSLYSKEVQLNVASVTKKMESIDQLKTKLAQLMTTYNALSGEERQTTANQDLKLSINDLIGTIEREQAVLATATTTAAKVALSTDTVTKKKTAETASLDANAGAYEALKAKADMAAMAALNLGAKFGMSSQEFADARNKANALTADLHRLEQTTSKVGRGANNANYSIFTLTQVMRELPNFAIDARIGFMSLSNNLPMLTQGFQDLTAKLGSSRAAFKMMLGSLLSLNTGMVIASTLMVMFGDKIMTALKKKLLDLDEAQQALNKTLKDGNSEYGTAVKKTYEASTAIDAYKAGNLGAEEALKLVNTQMEGQINAFKDIDAAITWFAGANTDAYLNAMYAQGLANIYLQTAVNNRAKADRIAANETITNAQIVGKSFSLLGDFLFKDIFNNGGILHFPQLIKDMGNAEKLILEGRDRTAAKLMAKSEADKAIYEAEMKKSFEGLKDIKNPKLGSTIESINQLKIKLKALQVTYRELSGEERKTVTGQKLKKDIIALVAEIKKAEATLSSDKVQSTIDVQRKGYEALTDTLKLVQEELKNTVAEEEQFGIKTPYETRIAGAKTWYDNEVKIASAEKLLKDTQIQEEYTRDKIKLSEQLARAEDKVKAQAEYNIAIGVLDKNRDDALLENKNEYLNSEKEANNQQKAWLYKIGQDKLDDRRSEVKAEETLLLQANEADRANAILAADAIYREKVGATKNNKDKQVLRKENREKLASIDAFYDAKALKVQQDTLKLLIALESTSDSDKLKYKQDLAALELKIEADKNAKLLSGNAAANASLEEQDTQSLEDRREILNEALSASQDLLAAYYDYVQQQIENQKNTELASLDDKHDKRLISDVDYEKQKEKINKDAFEKDKKLKIKQAWMEWALGLVRIWAQAGINPIVAGVASAALTAVTGANVAVISKSQYARKGMILNGPSHERGGIPVEAEGGEAIINKRSTSMFKPLLSALNQAGGGVRFAEGGIPGLRNDGGYATRAISRSLELGLTDRQIKAIVSNIRVYAAISDIHKADKEYATVESNGRF